MTRFYLKVVKLLMKDRNYFQIWKITDLEQPVCHHCCICRHQSKDWTQRTCMYQHGSTSQDTRSVYLLLNTIQKYFFKPLSCRNKSDHPLPSIELHQPAYLCKTLYCWLPDYKILVPIISPKLTMEN